MEADVKVRNLDPSSLSLSLSSNYDVAHCVSCHVVFQTGPLHCLHVWETPNAEGRGDDITASLILALQYINPSTSPTAQHQ